jgi:hypothetical protein
MALFSQGQGKVDVNSEVSQLRSQGLSDQQIMEEMKNKGVHDAQVISALNNIDSSAGAAGGPPQGPTGPSMGGGSMPPSGMPPPDHSTTGGSGDNLYDRIEEITENMIDEKWDELIGEVKKIIEWKQQMEEKDQKMTADLDKLKEDFKVLHQAVLGKVEEYDKRMQDVGTELKAVGKVFKDVIPVFTENVKELKSVTQGVKDKIEGGE